MNAQKELAIYLLEHKSCVKCEGDFQPQDQVYLDIFNKSYCEVCYRETYDA